MCRIAIIHGGTNTTPKITPIIQHCHASTFLLCDCASGYRTHSFFLDLTCLLHLKFLWCGCSTSKSLSLLSNHCLTDCRLLSLCPCQPPPDGVTLELCRRLHQHRDSFHSWWRSCSTSRTPCEGKETSQEQHEHRSTY